MYELFFYYSKLNSVLRRHVQACIVYLLKFCNHPKKILLARPDVVLLQFLDKVDEAMFILINLKYICTNIQKGMSSLLNATLGDCKIKLIFLLMQPKMYQLREHWFCKSSRLSWCPLNSCWPCLVSKVWKNNYVSRPVN